MRHRKAGLKLGRSASHRKAMFRNMVTSLFKHDRIQTTDAKAKELRRWADHLISLAKRGDLHARRQAMAVIREKDVVHKLFEEAPKRFGKLSGGYTRVVKLGTRPGDGAPVSIIELITVQTAPKKKKPAKKTSRAAAPKAAVKETPAETPDAQAEAEPAAKKAASGKKAAAKRPAPAAKKPAAKRETPAAKKAAPAKKPAASKEKAPEDTEKKPAAKKAAPKRKPLTKAAAEEGVKKTTTRAKKTAPAKKTETAAKKPPASKKPASTAGKKQKSEDE